MTVRTPSSPPLPPRAAGAGQIAPGSTENLPWFRRLVAFDHCRILLPNFTFLHRRDPVSRLHSLALVDPAAASAARPLEVFLGRILFAAVALRQVPLFFSRYASYVAATHRISRRRQLRDLWHCVWRLNQSPRHYYWRKLFRLPDRETWLLFLEHRQVNTLMDHLNRHLPITRATNKYSFYHHCLAHFLPTPEVHAVWTDVGRLITAVPLPLAHDLFAKPVAEYGSVGIMAIPYDSVTGTHRLDGRNLAWPDLLTALGHHARTTRQSLILQRQMRNAPRSSSFGRDDVCNLRIVTGRPPSGDPEAIASFIRLPSSLTTTGHDRHVLIASVDLENGRLSAGRFREITMGEYPVHPDTGAVIAGRLLPAWPELLELALRAHRTFPWLPFVGWDLIDTEEGIMLLEANAYWGADALQIPDAAPLGRTRFPEIYLQWFDFFRQKETPDFPADISTPHDEALESSCLATDRH